MQMQINKCNKLTFKTPPFSAGSTAENLSGYTAKNEYGRDSMCKDTHESLFLAAMYALGIPDGSNISVVRALPYDWRSDGERVAKHYTRKAWHIASDRNLTFSCVMQCRPQGILAAVNNAYGWDGIQDEKILENSVVIDIGGNTTEIIRIKDRGNSNRSASPTDTGTWSAARRLLELLHADGYDANVAEAMQSLESGEFYGHDISHFVGLSLSGLADRIESEVLRVADLAKVPYIVLSGGGSILLKDIFAKRWKKIYISEQPLYDNCLGAIKSIAGRTPKNIIPVGLDIGARNTKAVAIIGGKLVGVCFPSLVGEPVENALGGIEL